MVTTVNDNSPQAINTSLFSIQKQIDDLQKQLNAAKEQLGIDIDNVIDDEKTGEDTTWSSEKIDGELKKQVTGVSSVNGKEGTVTLSASDVGALPSTTTIPTKVSQLQNDSNYTTRSNSVVRLSAFHGDNYYYNANMNPTTYFYWHRVGRVASSSYSLIFRVTCKGDYNYGKYLAEWLVTATNYNGAFRLGVVKLGSSSEGPQLSVCIDTSGYVWIQAYILWNCSKTVELVTGYGADIELTKGSYAAWTTPAGFTKSVQITNEGQTN